MDVQRWVNHELQRSPRERNRNRPRKKGKTKKESPQRTTKKKVSVATVRGYFRVFRNMMCDAVVALGLPRDPTMRIIFPEGEEQDDNALTEEELARFLAAMKQHHPQHYALTLMLTFTGLPFCHASATKWEDIDEEAAIIHIRRKQRRGIVGPVSKKKRAPRRYRLPPELAAVLREHRARQLKSQAAGLDEGWVFPSNRGTLKTPGSLWYAWHGCPKAAKIEKRFTVHGLRRTFNDLTRRAGVDDVVIKALTGHVTEKMREHYSTVEMGEKQAAVASVVQLVKAAISVENGERSGDGAPKKEKAG